MEKKVKAAEVRFMEDGPAIVTGPVTLMMKDRFSTFSEQSVAICTCGKSAQNPFCDGSHKTKS